MKFLDRLTELFSEIKENVKNVSEEDVQGIIDESEKLKEKAKKLGQESMVNDIETDIKTRAKELEVIKAGYTRYCYRDDLRKIINKLSDKKVKNLVLEDIETYEHNIPDENAEEISNAKKYFDKMYILHTAYDEEVKKKDKEKDPICFGVVSIENENRNVKKLSKRLFYITDWEDEFCDLTLEKLIELSSQVGGDKLVKNEQDYIK